MRERPELRGFFGDGRFRWSENMHRLGHKRNFQHAIARCVASGVRWIACSDQDDVWYPGKLATLVGALERCGPLSLVHSDMHLLATIAGRTLQMDGTAWRNERRGVHHASGRDLLIRNVVTGAAMMMDADLARRFPSIPDEFDYHDHWYATLAAFHGGVYALAEPLYAYRQHENNVVGVAQFSGALALPPRIVGRGLPIARSRAIQTWQNMVRRARAVERVRPGRSLPRWMTWTAGVGLLVRGAVCFRDDPALTRACIRRGVGQMLSTKLGSS